MTGSSWKLNPWYVTGRILGNTGGKLWGCTPEIRRSKQSVPLKVKQIGFYSCMCEWVLLHAEAHLCRPAWTADKPESIESTHRGTLAHSEGAVGFRLICLLMRCNSNAIWEENERSAGISDHQRFKIKGTSIYFVSDWICILAPFQLSLHQRVCSYLPIHPSSFDLQCKGSSSSIYSLHCDLDQRVRPLLTVLIFFPPRVVCICFIK